MRAQTFAEHRRLYLLSRALIERHYRRPLTVGLVARALSVSPRQLQRIYSVLGARSFSEELAIVRMRVAAQLLIEQPSIPVAHVGRLVGYPHGPHFARAFRRRYGISPSAFRQVRGRGADRVGRPEERCAAVAPPLGRLRSNHSDLNR